MGILFQEISKNASLRFIDDETAKEYSLAELPSVTLPDRNKELVFLYLDNSVTAVGVFLSLLKSAHTIALLSPTLSIHFKDSLEALYKPAYIYDTTREVIASYNRLDQNVYCRNEKVNWEINDRIKVLISTSGTTGSPKFVKLSEENILSNARSISAYLPINNKDVTPLNLPIYYSYGLSVLTSNSLKGGKIVCTNTDVLKREFWDKMNQYGYTSIAGVPFVYEMLDRIGFTKKVYPSLKYFTQAGGKLQNVLVEKFANYAQENNVLFYVMYGQTEATARMSYLPPDRLHQKIGSIGIAIPNGAFQIDEDNYELGYSGPNIYGGYVTEPGDLSSYEQPELLRTGDIAKKDEEGFYYITGRLKRFVKLFGNRINLDEIEVLLSAQFSRNIKSMGINDKLLLLVTTEEGIDNSEVINFLVKELKLHSTVIKLIYIEEYPLTENGKIDYNKIVALHGAV